MAHGIFIVIDQPGIPPLPSPGIQRGRDDTGGARDAQDHHAPTSNGGLVVADTETANSQREIRGPVPSFSSFPI
jgi:hypothetical protein